MTLSKRTRYEVLRRDDFACRYCGQRAPQVQLHVDHVVPRSMGGSDDLSNLTAACVDCNLGKSDGAPTDDVIADVRLAHSLYTTAHGDGITACKYCTRPVVVFAGDDPGEHECEMCNRLICDAWEAGRGIKRPTSIFARVNA